MAKLNPTYNQTDIGVAINRSNGQPLDPTEVWNENIEGKKYDDLAEYIKGDQAFVGQRVTYIDADGKAHSYTIVGEGENSTLQSEIPDVDLSDCVTKTELENYVTKTELNDNLSEYVTETELENKKYLSEVAPKDVIFDYDIVVSHPIGSIKPEDFGGKSAITLETTGQSLEVVLRNIFGGELQPNIIQDPQYSFTASEKHVGEVGEEFDAPEATFKVTSVGEYTYDGNEKHNDTGVTFSGSITGGHNTEEFTNLGYNEKCTVAFGADNYIYTETPKTFSFSGQYSYTEGKKLTTNLDNETDVFISSSASNISIPPISSGAYTGYRKIFVGAVEYSAPDSFSSEDIRELGRLNSNSWQYADGNTKTFYVTAPQGTTLVIAAFPVDKYNKVTFEYMINGSYTNINNVNITDYDEVYVEGANGYTSATYHVYAYQPKNNSGALQAAQTDFRITVKK